MKLSQLIPKLSITIHPDEHWAITGPEADEFAAKLSQPLLSFQPQIVPQLDGLLLAAALSAAEDPETWLTQIAGAMRNKSRLIVIDWQADGPLDTGPDLAMRLKRGRVRRLLREAGFGQIDIHTSHPIYYLIDAHKVPSPALPTEFVTVAHVDQLPKNRMKLVEVFGHKIIVANTGKEFVAFAQSCPHAGGSINKGLLRGQNVACPLHGYIWNVCTGEPVQPDDEDILPRYAVKVQPDSGQILVALTPPQQAD